MGLAKKIKATVGKRPLLEALKVRYPQYSPGELDKLEELIIGAVAEAIRKGKHVTFMEMLPGGHLELDAIYVQDTASQITNEMRAG